MQEKQYSILTYIMIYPIKYKEQGRTRLDEEIALFNTKMILYLYFHIRIIFHIMELCSEKAVLGKT
jgi:hypothetical protein